VVLTELISGPGQKSILAPVLPSRTKVREIRIDRGVATVDLDAGFIESYWGGSRSEELTVYSIVNSLTEIEGIDAVRLTLDGRSDVSIAGHIALDQTFHRESRLIAEAAAGEVR
jgi:spore germination protein GerM